MPNETPEVPEGSEFFITIDGESYYHEDHKTDGFQNWPLKYFVSFPHPVKIRCCAMAAFEWRKLSVKQDRCEHTPHHDCQNCMLPCNADKSDASMDIANQWDEKGFAI